MKDEGGGVHRRTTKLAILHGSEKREAGDLLSVGHERERNIMCHDTNVKY